MQNFNLYNPVNVIFGPGESRKIGEYAKKLGKKALLRGVEIFSAAQGNIRFAARPEIVLESAVLRFLLPEGEKDASALEYRVQRLEQQLARLGLPAVEQGRKKINNLSIDVYNVFEYN